MRDRYYFLVLWYLILILHAPTIVWGIFIVLSGQGSFWGAEVWGGDWIIPAIPSTLAPLFCWVWMNPKGVHGCMGFKRYHILWKDMRCIALITHNARKPLYVFSTKPRVWSSTDISFFEFPHEDYIIIHYNWWTERIVNKYAQIPIEKKTFYTYP